MKNEIDKLREDIYKSEENQVIFQESLVDAKRSLGGLQTQFDKANENNLILEKTIEDKDYLISKYDIEKRQMETKIIDLGDEIDKLKQDIFNKEENQVKIQESLDDAKRSLGDLQTKYDKTIEEKDDLISKYDIEQRQMESKIKDLGDEIDKLKQDIFNKEENQVKIQETLDDAKRSFGDLQTHYDKTIKEKDDLISKYDIEQRQMETKITDLSGQVIVLENKIKEDEDDLEGSISDYMEKLNCEKEDKKLIKKLENQIKELNLKIQSKSILNLKGLLLTSLTYT